MTTMLAVALAALSLMGCAQGPRVERTPKYQIPVHVRADVPEDRQTVLLWVDLRADEWIERKAAWGCAGLSDGVLRRMVRDEVVLVYPGYTLPDSGTMGYNDLGVAIHVTVNDPPLVWTSDLYNGAGVGIVAFDYSYGLRQLPHEWTHTARGNWHP